MNIQKLPVILVILRVDAEGTLHYSRLLVRGMFGAIQDYNRVQRMKVVSSLDRTDMMILDLLKGDARMSFQELGDKIGMSRVAAKKRVQKLENDGVIKGYNTCIYREDEITMFIDIVTIPGKYEDVLKYVSTRTAFIRQIFRTTKENHIHMIAVSDSAQNLAYLIRMIRKKCGDDIDEFHCYAVKEVVKDVYGGIRYEDRTEADSEGNHE